MQNVPIHIDYKGRQITGVADPLQSKEEQGIPLTHIVYLSGKYLGILSCEKEGWNLDRPADPELVETLGKYIHAWYE